MKRLTRMLWWCAGARIDILEKEECKSDHAKFFGIGGTILFTALMASFAGGYAFFTAFKDPLLSMFFGAFWGLLIFNLDRYIVSTIKDDGKPSISRGEIINAAPRLIMSVLLGFVIATPLELKIFETEIQTVVERLKIEKAEELKSKDVSFYADLDSTNIKLTRINNDISIWNNKKGELTMGSPSFIVEQRKSKENELNKAINELKQSKNIMNNLHNQYLKVKYDTTISNQVIQERKNKYLTEKSHNNSLIKSQNEIMKDLKTIDEDKVDFIKKELANINNQIAILETQQKSLQSQSEQKEATKVKKNENYENKVENYDGFAAHLEAMSILTSEKSAIFWAKWLITILFIFIEVAPVLFKLMVEAGPYDEILQRQKYEAMVKQKLAISMLNDEINTTLIISAQKNKEKLSAELNGNEELMRSIALAQAEIGKKAVDKWKEIELEKLDKSLNNIVNPSITPEGYTSAS